MNDTLIITLSSWKCFEIGIEDADIYIDFLRSDVDETANEMSISWLPIHAAEHDSRIEYLSYPDMKHYFGGYTEFQSQGDQEKLINWIAHKTKEKPNQSFS
ncbi:hypothetical protein [Brucella gallinifaecis]|uniref:hypothetical protein n=1 Tax=Brucella gallinifaecis TaxID=215590 RepID=UPI00235F2664|nr:hypothetical protein [Brucella gallinifaecis]